MHTSLGATPSNRGAPIQELEKAIIYDVLRRFRVYVTDQPLDTPNQSVLMFASLNVPDFSDSDRTEKRLTAAVAVVSDDTALLQAARGLFGRLPVALVDTPKIDETSELARLLHGTMRDALAAGFVVNT